jgi:hypothetical protein
MAIAQLVYILVFLRRYFHFLVVFQFAGTVSTQHPQYLGIFADTPRTIHNHILKMFDIARHFLEYTGQFGMEIEHLY